MVYKSLSITEKVREYLKEFSVVFHDAVGLKDKLVILVGYSKTPIYFYNYLMSNRNKKPLISDVTIKNKYGTFFCGNDLYSVLYFSSSFEPEVRKKMYGIKDGWIIDVGANGGMHTIPLAKNLESGKVISIEPEPKNFRILKKNIKLNKLKNVIPLKIACSDKDGKSYLYLDEGCMGGHTIILEGYKQRKIEIKTARLDNLLRKLKIDKIALMKVDVEGAESLVLKGAKETIKKYHPEIVFEAQNEDCLDKVKGILEPLGYRIENIARDNYFAI